MVGVMAASKAATWADSKVQKRVAEWAAPMAEW